MRFGVPSSAAAAKPHCFLENLSAASIHSHSSVAPSLSDEVKSGHAHSQLGNPVTVKTKTKNLCLISFYIV